MQAQETRKAASAFHWNKGVGIPMLFMLDRAETGDTTGSFAKPQIGLSSKLEESDQTAINPALRTYLRDRLGTQSNFCDRAGHNSFRWPASADRYGACHGTWMIGISALHSALCTQHSAPVPIFPRDDPDPLDALPEAGDAGRCPSAFRRLRDRAAGRGRRGNPRGGSRL